MFDQLVAFLTGDQSSDAPASPSVDLSVAALLVEAARMDDTFGDEERATIRELLVKRFSLNTNEADTLIAKAGAQVDETHQYFRFTHEITHSMSEDERAEVIEMLWRVAYADGVLDPHEDALIRQISGLIGISDRARMLARQRALGTG